MRPPNHPPVPPSRPALQQAGSNRRTQVCSANGEDGRWCTLYIPWCMELDLWRHDTCADVVRVVLISPLTILLLWPCGPSAVCGLAQALPIYPYKLRLVGPACSKRPRSKDPNAEALA